MRRYFETETGRRSAGDASHDDGCGRGGWRYAASETLERDAEERARG